MTAQHGAEAAGITVVSGSLYRVRDRHGYVFADEPPLPPPDPVKRPARIARMLAMAHRVQGNIDEGKYPDRAEAARQLDLTRARLTQLMNLLLLAPDIQEEVLFLESVDGIEPLTERAIREIVQIPDWQVQRQRWRDLRARRARKRGRGLRTTRDKENR